MTAYLPSVKLIKEFARKGLLALERKNEIGQFDGIMLVDPDYYTPYFTKVISGALQLIKDTDARRFQRVQQYVRSIVNCTQPMGGGSYFYLTKTCEFEFREPRSEHDVPFYTAWYACALVHEATHGRLHSRGIEYSPENRTRVEKLCVLEEQRLANHLKVTPEVSAWLQQQLTFDPRRWERHWKITRWKRLLLTIRRIRKRDRRKR